MMMKRVVIVVLAVVVIAVALSLLIPNRNARVRASQPCWSNLVNLEAAKFALEHEMHAARGSPVAVSNIISVLSYMPTCNVAGATYILGKIGEEPGCTVHGTTSHFKPDHY